MRVVLSDKGLGKGIVEYKGRTDSDATDVARDQIVQFVLEKLVS